MVKVTKTGKTILLDIVFGDRIIYQKVSINVVWVMVMMVSICKSFE